jgi:hypothetical protein
MNQETIMLQKITLAAIAGTLLMLALPSKLDAYGAARVGYVRAGPGGVSYGSRTVVSGPGGVYAGGRAGAVGYGGGAYRAGYAGGVGVGGAAGYRYGGVGGAYGAAGYRYGYIR